MGNAALPRRYRAWVGATTVSQIGDAVLFFALGWAASGYGGAAAGLVLAAVTVPRTLLMLVGGAVADRIGPRRVLLAADAALCAGSVAAVAVVAAVGTPLWLLVAVGAVVGTVTSFYYPAAGSLPARLVRREQLPRALALRTAGFQLAALTGAPIGGLLVLSGGVGAVLGVNAASYLVVLGVVLALRPAPPDAPPVRTGLVGETVDALRVTLRTPALRRLLGLYAVVAGSVIPVANLIVPLLARERGWSAGGAGLVVGAEGAGALLASVVAARRGLHRRADRGAAVGLGVAAAGVAGLAGSSALPFAVAAGLLLGVGITTFIVHAGPLLVLLSPDTHLARVQAVLSLVQSAMLTASTPLLGLVAGSAGATAAAAVSAGALAVTGAVAWPGGGGGGRESNPPGRDARPRRF